MLGQFFDANFSKHCFELERLPWSTKALNRMFLSLCMVVACFLNEQVFMVHICAQIQPSLPEHGKLTLLREATSCGD